MGGRNEGEMERRRGIEGVERERGGKIVKGERREGGRKKEK